MNRRRRLAIRLAFLLGIGVATTSWSQPPPIVGTVTDSQHNFLTFSNFNALGQSPYTSMDYYQAVDPGGKKLDFRDWLVNAGFIKDRDDWRATGQRIYTDVPGDYGPNKINAFAHLIVLNAADLGYIRNQYIRCNPDCKTKGARIYAYLENYPVPKDSIGDIALTRLAVNSVLESRRVDPLERTNGRVADFAVDWAPASNGSAPPSPFGQPYAFVVHAYTEGSCGAGSPVLNPDGSAKIEERYNWPEDKQFWDCRFNSRPSSTAGPDFLDPLPEFSVVSGQPFAPELDRLGTKMHPGVCYICHGGNAPSTVQTTHVWPNQGRNQGFRFLPGAAGNLVFGVDDTALPVVGGARGSNLTRAGQEREIKKYNQVAAITQGASPPANAVFAPDGTIAGGNWTVPRSRDEQGTLRPSHALEVIFGWYAAYSDDLSMGAGVQNDAFIPLGWRSTDETRNLYRKVVAPSCASCHMNRKRSLDFGTQAQFDRKKESIQDQVFQPECDSTRDMVSPGRIVMPLAKQTWDRFWNGIDPESNLAFDAANTLPADDPNSQPFLLKRHFGYTATSYCDAQK